MTNNDKFASIVRAIRASANSSIRTNVWENDVSFLNYVRAQINKNIDELIVLLKDYNGIRSSD